MMFPWWHQLQLLFIARLSVSRIPKYSLFMSVEFSLNSPCIALVISVSEIACSTNSKLKLSSRWHGECDVSVTLYEKIDQAGKFLSQYSDARTTTSSCLVLQSLHQIVSSVPSGRLSRRKMSSVFRILLIPLRDMQATRPWISLVQLFSASNFDDWATNMDDECFRVSNWKGYQNATIFPWSTSILENQDPLVIHLWAWYSRSNCWTCHLGYL